MDLTVFAAEVGPDGPVMIAGMSTRRTLATTADTRSVAAPSGIIRVTPADMVIECGAATPVAELVAALAEVGQTVNLPAGGTVGGALAVGRSDVRRLGYGPIRDTVLQIRYINANGGIVTAGGPTVKNVSGFDLCRLMVGSWGTLGFFGTVLLRTRPVPPFSQWYRTERAPEDVLVGLYRPTSVLWDGEHTWALLEGDPRDCDAQTAALGLVPDEMPALPTGGRWSIPPSHVGSLGGPGRFVAEVGVGIVHHTEPPPARVVDPIIADLNARMKRQFDPTERLNPGIDVLHPDA